MLTLRCLTLVLLGVGFLAVGCPKKQTQVVTPPPVDDGADVVTGKAGLAPGWPLAGLDLPGDATSVALPAAIQTAYMEGTEITADGSGMQVFFPGHPMQYWYAAFESTAPAADLASHFEGCLGAGFQADTEVNAGSLAAGPGDFQLLYQSADERLGVRVYRYSDPAGGLDPGAPYIIFVQDLGAASA